MKQTQYGRILMDFSELDLGTTADGGKIVELFHPSTRQPLLTDDKEKITVTVLGRYSDKYMAMQRQINNRRLATQRGSRVKITSEEIEAETSDILANCIIAWHGVQLNGEMLECNYANARMLLEDRRFGWFREQIDDAVNDDANFMRESKKK